MIELYHAAQSRSFRVLWFLHEAGLDHRLHRMAFAGKSLRDPEFLKISPAGRVPAAVIDGRTMFESGAIMDYLAETRAPHLTRAPGHPERAAYLEWLHYGETIGQHLAQLTQQHIVLREDCMRSPTVMKLEAMRLQRAIAGLAAGSGGDYILPSGFSVADIAVGYGVHMARYFTDLAPTGILSYVERLEARAGFLRAKADDGPIELYTQDFYHVPDAG